MNVEGWNRLLKGTEMSIFGSNFHRPWSLLGSNDFTIHSDVSLMIFVIKSLLLQRISFKRRSVHLVKFKRFACLKTKAMDSSDSPTKSQPQKPFVKFTIPKWVRNHFWSSLYRVTLVMQSLFFFFFFGLHNETKRYVLLSTVKLWKMSNVRLCKSLVGMGSHGSMPFFFGIRLVQYDCSEL